MIPKGELRTDTIALLRFGHKKRHPRARRVDQERIDMLKGFETPPTRTGSTGAD